KGDPGGRERMERLLADQAYRLAFWRTGTREINYRRFFDVSGLAGVRVEDSAVFEATHELVLRLAQEGKITGLRVDHIDGLHDPTEYLRRLQRQLAPATTAEGSTPGFPIIVEKILTGDETLPDEWPVSGTTGYDFLNTVNGVFVDASGLEALDAAYSEFIGREVSFPDEVYERKRQVAEELFEGELLRLARELRHLAEQDAGVGDMNEQALSQALLETSVCLPVYRTYVRDFEVSPRDRRYLERALAEAQRRNPAVRGPAFDFLRRVLLLDLPASLSDEQRQAWLRFVMRWQQFTGPLTAKGLEDTALYRYSRLLSVNEVGADPEAMGALDVSTFHRRNEARLQRWPATMSATATHDTKRGEDVRARINVLSELPDEWSERLTRWRAWNRDRKREVDGQLVPDANEELLLYQTMIGAWPLDEEEAPAFGERLKAYAVKAAREAKLHTSWLDADEAYERALTEFVEAVLAPSKENRFLPDLLSFQKQVAYYGAMNSLAQLVLKIASPGVPDFYQGTELWDFSLVDPDNRRPVDFGKRVRLLEALKEREATDRRPLVRELLARWPDGRIKLYITMRALHARRADADLFLRGDYLPLSASGKAAAHTIAFARRRGKAWALVAVPRLASRLAAEGEPPVGEAVWGESAIALPDGAPTRWRNVFTGESLETTAAGRTMTLPLRSALAELPVCLLSGVSGEG
ncbi:MAG: malto-oligosyltrehalose synthase, partial [Chloroflexi bacterium]|nr:malto-oligosyltrehalose synthase [Chloroflexota bacterium]